MTGRRLLQAIAGRQQGGAEIFFLRMAAALEQAGEVQRVLIRRDRARAEGLRAAGVEVAEFRFGGTFDVATRFGFRREIASFRPDIVLTWMNRATRLCPRGEFVHVARLGGYYDLKYYRCCDHLIGNTRAIVDYAVGQGWPRDRVHYLPNFVPELAAAPPLPRAEFGTPNDVPLALALGRLHPNKGFDLLLEALAETRDVHLWLAGEGEIRGALEHRAVELGLAERVRFLGWRDDVPALLRSVDLLVCPSRHEPLGNVVIEAWSAGLPVVATASDGPVSLIEDGESGILVPLADAPALARAIERVCGDAALAASLGRGGRAAYEAGFTEAAVVTRWRIFLAEVAR